MRKKYILIVGRPRPPRESRQNQPVKEGALCSCQLMEHDWLNDCQRYCSWIFGRALPWLCRFLDHRTPHDCYRDLFDHPVWLYVGVVALQGCSSPEPGAERPLILDALRSKRFAVLVHTSLYLQADWPMVRSQNCFKNVTLSHLLRRNTSSCVSKPITFISPNPLTVLTLEFPRSILLSQTRGLYQFSWLYTSNCSWGS